MIVIGKCCRRFIYTTKMNGRKLHVSATNDCYATRVGSVFLEDCQIQRYIPIYLIVFGSVGVVRSVSSFVQNIRNRRNNADREENTKTNPFDGLLGCFLFVWFICGKFADFRQRTDSVISEILVVM